MTTIILIDLKNEKEVAKYISYNPEHNKKTLDNFIQSGKTELGYEEETGDIVFAIEKGKLIYAANKKVAFKRIA